MTSHQNSPQRSLAEKLADMEHAETMHALSDRQLLDVLQDIGRTAPGDVMQRGGLRAAILQAVYDLPDLQHRIVTESCGIGKKESQTLRAFAAAAALTEAYVCVKRTEALAMLRGAIVYPEDPIKPVDPADEERVVTPEEVIASAQLVSFGAVAMENLPRAQRETMIDWFHDEPLKDIAKKNRRTKDYVRQSTYKAFEKVSADISTDDTVPQRARERGYLTPLRG